MPSTIAFTSCIRREAFPDQPQWDDIAAADPDHLLLLGDQIYMDFGYWPFSHEWNGRPRDYDVATFRDVMADKYRQQWAEPHFRALYDRLRARDRIHAIWDDHDFAWNNAIGSEVDATRRQVAYDLFRERFPVSVPGEIYQSIDTALAQVILLDLRSHARAPLRAAGADAAASRLLGEAQFAFLERELLARPEKPFVVIGSSITLRDGDENWSCYPQDHARLMQAIADCGRRVILLAGDIHRNVFHPRGPGQPCHELIASGMAINYLGLGIAEDDRCNWGLLRLFEDGHAEATLVDRHGTNPCRLNW